VDLSCTNTNTVTKQSKMRFQTMNVIEGFHRVRPKWFLSSWYIRRKPCTYLTSRLAISPNVPKDAFSWASLLRSTIGCIQSNFWAYITTFGTNCAPILHPNVPKWDSTWPTSSWSSIGCVQNDFQAYGSSVQTMHRSCIKSSTISKRTETSF
jgi:hypothetical protein